MEARVGGGVKTEMDDQGDWGVAGIGGAIAERMPGG